jgi:hypothetical protein
MHVAWWDTRRPAVVRADRPHPFPGFPSWGSGFTLADEFPGLRSSHCITARERTSGDSRSTGTRWSAPNSSSSPLSERTLGCAPSHRWAFCDTSPQHEHAEDLPAELELLLHA